MDHMFVIILHVCDDDIVYGVYDNLKDAYQALYDKTYLATAYERRYYTGAVNYRIEEHVKNNWKTCVTVYDYNEELGKLNKRA